MSSAAQESTAAGALAPIRPALFVRMFVRPMTKALNPRIKKRAGRPDYPMAALLRHTGRRSGRRYATPVGARIFGDTIVIPLTFGNSSDWAQNVRAADGCSVLLNGTEYAATGPRFLALADAGSLIQTAFRPAERASFRLLGIRQVMTLHAVAQPQPTGPESVRAARGGRP
jgi:deazaflavin-dependent oxidoreductase (nitroreductase family)